MVSSVVSVGARISHPSKRITLAAGVGSGGATGVPGQSSFNCAKILGSVTGDRHGRAGRTGSNLLNALLLRAVRAALYAAIKASSHVGKELAVGDFGINTNPQID
jgi:hypothetical protein